MTKIFRNKICRSKQQNIPHLGDDLGSWGLHGMAENIQQLDESKGLRDLPDGDKAAHHVPELWGGCDDGSVGYAVGLGG